MRVLAGVTDDAEDPAPGEILVVVTSASPCSASPWIGCGGVQTTTGSTPNLDRDQRQGVAPPRPARPETRTTASTSCPTSSATRSASATTTGVTTARCRSCTRRRTTRCRTGPATSPGCASCTTAGRRSRPTTTSPRRTCSPRRCPTMAERHDHRRRPRTGRAAARRRAPGGGVGVALVDGGGQRRGHDRDRVDAPSTPCVGVYRGTSLDALTEVASNDDGPASAPAQRGPLQATAGVTYRIAVDGADGDAGPVHAPRPAVGGRTVQLRRGLRRSGSTATSSAPAVRPSPSC